MDYNEDRAAEFSDAVFRAIVQGWVAQIDFAKKYRDEKFGNTANDCQAFFNGPRNWSQLMAGIGLGSDKNDELPDPAFKFSINKCFEFVTIFGPTLYYDNPVRTVKPRMPVDLPIDFFPDAQVYQSLIQEEQIRVQVDGLKATVLNAYLNWTPHEFGLCAESRRAIDEALIKGASLLWTELYSPPGAAFQAVRSHFDSIDNLLIDPDASSFREAKWIARRCVHPVWQVEREYNLAPGTLKGTGESIAKQADIENDSDAQDSRRRGLSNDVVTYWKIWSKMGIGGRLPGVSKQNRKACEMFGDYCYMVVAPSCTGYLLNLAPSVMDDPGFGDSPDPILSRVAWPTPFWAKDRWPCSMLAFHEIAECPWPMAHLKAGMGELKFLNWAHCFLMGHIRNSSRDFLVIKKGLNEEAKTTLLHGQDLEVIEVESDEDLEKIAKFLQHPQMNADIWKVIAAVETNFDKRVGLTDLMYGETQSAMRSATEANAKNENANIRPADMARQVETWQAEVAQNEAMAARYHLISADTRPVLGAVGGWAWDAYVKTDDIQAAARELEYEIESGSTAKPNKNAEVEKMSGAVQVIGPIFETAAQAGDVQPMNNLLADWAKSQDLDPAKYQLSQPLMDPAPPAGPGGEQPAPGQGGPESVQQVPTSAPLPSG